MMKRHLGPHLFLGVSALVAFACVGCGKASPSTSGPPTAAAIAYVAHSNSHSMSIIQIPADQTVSTIQIGNSSFSSGATQASAPQNVVVSPDESRAYVTDGIASVWVVDTKARSVVTTIPAGTAPQYVAISPNGKNVYVTTFACGAAPCPPSVAVIDTTTNKVVATIPAGKIGTNLVGLAVTPDGTRVFVAPGRGNDVWAIDTTTNSIVATIPTSNSGFSDVAVSPDGDRVYAVGFVIGPYMTSNFLEVIDTKTNAVSASIPVGTVEATTRMALTPDGGHAYIAGDGGHVWVVDTTLNALMTTIPVSSAGNPILGIAITPDGARAYATCGNANTIYVLGTAANDVVSTIPSEYPGGLTIGRAM